MKIPLDLQAVRKYLLNRPLKLFGYLSGSRFTRGLPQSEDLQNVAVARVLKKAITSNGIPKSALRHEDREFKQALDEAWRKGWLHAEKTRRGIRYVFASKIHHW